MDSSNLAICIGPNMLSPGTDSALPLEVQKEMNDKVTVLVEFLINNCLEIFEGDIAFPACALAEESPEHTDSSTGIIQGTIVNWKILISAISTLCFIGWKI
ncbi:T-cell activation Rho GTPase-activating protein-like [Motacilla alba alba]|uniref:T-cell activation Rho GTPase-activating protein-like n=1 Tax=Motacilla alba alba TaxID=1094192 RepID=UPI0018D53850|nr:T-cell activation Rho GTPase-activating protein-like [Motacilla alba alba]